MALNSENRFSIDFLLLRKCMTLNTFIIDIFLLCCEQHRSKQLLKYQANRKENQHIEKENRLQAK